MPRRWWSSSASLNWLGVLVGASLIGAAASIAAIYGAYWSQGRDHAEIMTGGNSARGKDKIGHYGCAACHVIPVIHGATGKVGPDLTHVGLRATLAGVLANDPDQMVRWLMHPQAVVPGSAMPEMGLTEADARDVAAYLYAQQ